MYKQESIELIDKSDRVTIDGISTATSTTALSETQKKLWISHESSRSFIFKLFTCFYAIFLLIIGILIELSNLVVSDELTAGTSTRNLVVGVWLFGLSIVFICYSAALVLQHHQKIRTKRRTIRLSTTSRGAVEPEVLSNMSTGSLYLRLGCVIFGIIGVVYYLLIFLICTLGWSSTVGECTIESDILNILQAIFIFLQMWFVYCNGKILFIGKGNIARLGLMHLTGTNLYMWLRYIIIEEHLTIQEIREHSRNISRVHHHTIGGFENDPNCSGVLCLFNGYNEFMYTCVVEYSLICAGIAFVFWTNIEKIAIHRYEKRLRKRNILKIDCSRTSEGLFAGFGFIIITIIAIALFNAYSGRENLATWIYSCTNLAFMLVATVMTVFGFYRLRYLNFLMHDDDSEDDSAELLDRILLVVGLMGELVFGVGGLLAFLNNPVIGLPMVIAITNALRLVQVTLQSGMIIVAGRLRLNPEDTHMMRYKPGKQVVTLLLMINCCQFMLNVFEAQKAGINEDMLTIYGSYYWAILLRACSPLIIFYRFHSSACFAEIWKKTFRAPKNNHKEVANNGGSRM